MNREWGAVLTACASARLVSTVCAKRSPPKPVASAAKGGVEYTAGLTAETEGLVIATWSDGARKVEVWRRQIYTIKHEYRLGLERDVQTCFITKLELQDGKLKIWNEEGSEFELDLDTLDVEVLKGRAVIDHSKANPT